MDDVMRARHRAESMHSRQILISSDLLILVDMCSDSPYAPAGDGHGINCIAEPLRLIELSANMGGPCYIPRQRGVSEHWKP